MNHDKAMAKVNLQEKRTRTKIWLLTIVFWLVNFRRDGARATKEAAVTAATRILHDVGKTLSPKLL